MTGYLVLINPEDNNISTAPASESEAKEAISRGDLIIAHTAVCKSSARSFARNLRQTLRWSHCVVNGRTEILPTYVPHSESWDMGFLKRELDKRHIASDTIPLDIPIGESFMTRDEAVAARDKPKETQAARQVTRPQRREEVPSVRRERGLLSTLLGR